MENTSEDDETSDVLYINQRIIKAAFNDEISMREIEQMNIADVLVAAKTIHFIMQEIVRPKFLELDPTGGEELETPEKSAFEDYDIENGYDETPDKLNIWRICKENTDRVVKLAIRIMGDSWADCMAADIMCLLDYVKFEIATLKENNTTTAQ